MRRRPSPAMVVAIVALIAALGGGAYAVIPNGSGQIHGCYGPNGQLRVVDKSDDCRRSETAISWSQRGPAGPKGATGPQGPKGDSGGRAIVARARGSAPVLVTANLGPGNPYPLSGATWTQAAGELNEFVGLISYESPACPGDQVEPGTVFATLLLDGKELGITQFTGTAKQGVNSFDFRVFDLVGNRLGQESLLFEPGSPTSHTLTATLKSTCPAAPPRMRSLAVDVIATR